MKKIILLGLILMIIPFVMGDEAWEFHTDNGTFLVNTSNLIDDSYCKYFTSTGLDCNYNGSSGSTLTEEQVEDYVGGMLGGTETGISVTYEDATGDIDFVVTATDLSGYFDDIANFTGTLTNTKWCLYDGTDIVCDTEPVTDTDTYFNNQDASEVNMSFISGATYTTLEDWFDVTQSAGKLSGGDFSANANGSMNVSAGTGIIKIASLFNSHNKFFDWSAEDYLSLINDSTNYIYVDYNGGTPTINAQVGSAGINNRNEFLLGKVFRDGNTLHMVDAGLYIPEATKNILTYLTQVNGEVKRASGFVVGETGTRELTATEGVLFAGLTRVTTSAFDSSGADTFDIFYRDGGVGWTEVIGQTNLSNLLYDDDSGTLATLGVNDYGVFWIYGHDDGNIQVVYGQSSYNTLAEAEVTHQPSTLPTVISDIGFLASKVIIKKSGASFTSIESAYDVIFHTTPVTTHSDLSNLDYASAGHTGFEAELTDEASLYSTLSDVTGFYETGEDLILGNYDLTLGGGYSAGGITAYYNGSLFIGDDLLIDGDILTITTLSTNGSIIPSTDDAYDLGSSALQWKDGYFDGTLEADAITIGGTGIGSIYEVQLTNEAGLYGVLSDVTEFTETGDDASFKNLTITENYGSGATLVTMIEFDNVTMSANSTHFCIVGSSTICIEN